MLLCVHPIPIEWRLFPILQVAMLSEGCNLQLMLSNENQNSCAENQI